MNAERSKHCLNTIFGLIHLVHDDSLSKVAGLLGLAHTKTLDSAFLSKPSNDQTNFDSSYTQGSPPPAQSH